VIYVFVLSWIFQSQLPSGWGAWGEFLLGWSAFYGIACVFLYGKERIKEREAKKHSPADKTDEDSQVLLDILHERGVLTQDEYERKSDELAART